MFLPGIMASSRTIRDVNAILNPFVWYRLNDAPASNIVLDSSGNGKNATYATGAQRAAAISKGGSCFQPRGQTTAFSFGMVSAAAMGSVGAHGFIWSMFLKRDFTRTPGTVVRFLFGDASVDGLRNGATIQGSAIRWNPSTSHGTPSATWPAQSINLADTNPHMYTLAYRIGAGRTKYQCYLDGVPTTTINPSSAVTIATGGFTLTIRGGQPDEFPSSYGNDMYMAEVLSAPNFPTDAEEASAILNAYNALKL